jgi:ribosomal protein S18 acetylase RimI-like enzyme
MNIRRFEKRDREEYLAMSEEFYATDAVLSPVPKKNFEKTFDLLLSGSSFVDGYLVEEEGKAVAYALLSFTWSNEAGGMVVWGEELYVRPQYRGKGIGKAVIARIFQDHGKGTARFRLETEESNEDARRLYRRLGFRDLPYLQMVLDRSEANG